LKQVEKENDMRSHAKVQLKSLGTLSPSEKTKPRSPDMTGKLKILKKTLREIINTHREGDGDAFEANVAVWLYNSDGERYMTLELSPRYRSGVQRSAKETTVEDFFNEMREEREPKGKSSDESGRRERVASR
jgi:hypothetical protein